MMHDYQSKVKMAYVADIAVTHHIASCPRRWNVLVRLKKAMVACSSSNGFASVETLRSQVRNSGMVIEELGHVHP